MRKIDKRVERILVCKFGKVHYWWNVCTLVMCECAKICTEEFNRGKIRIPYPNQCVFNIPSGEVGSYRRIHELQKTLLRNILFRDLPFYQVTADCIAGRRLYDFLYFLKFQTPLVRKRQIQVSVSNAYKMNKHLMLG